MGYDQRITKSDTAERPPLSERKGMKKILRKIIVKCSNALKSVSQKTSL